MTERRTTRVFATVALLFIIVEELICLDCWKEEETIVFSSNSSSFSLADGPKNEALCLLDRRIGSAESFFFPYLIVAWSWSRFKF